MTTGILFALLVASSVFVYAAATDAWALVRRKYRGRAPAVDSWNPNEVEGTLESGISVVKFFLSSHKKLEDPQIDRLCRNVRWGTLAQITFGVVLIYVLGHS